MTDRRNQYGGPCAHCSQWVPAGEGVIAAIQDPAAPTGYRRAPVHLGVCPKPRNNGRSGEQRAFDARVSEQQQAVVAPRGDPHVAAQWVAYAQFRSISRPGDPLTIEQLDDVLASADLADMDSQVAQARKAILRSTNIHDPVRW